jgi:hypothetical protein
VGQYESGSWVFKQHHETGSLVDLRLAWIMEQVECSGFIASG